MDAEEAVVRAYYERGEERDRLSDGRGQLEFIRTTEIVARRLPPAPAVIADIGGGPGRYALWLASFDYQVERPVSTASSESRSTSSTRPPSTLVDEAERTGVFPPLRAGAFSACSHQSPGARPRADRLRPSPARHRDPSCDQVSLQPKPRRYD
jgi:hypothetical protein